MRYIGEEFDKLTGSECEIVRVGVVRHRPHPTNDWYAIRLTSGSRVGDRLVVAPEDLDPIPAPGAGR